MNWPIGFTEQMRSLLGDEADAFFEAMERPHVTSLRLNPLRAGAAQAALPFTGDAVPWCPDGRYLKDGVRPGLSPLHDAGAYYIQEASAMAPAMVLNAQPGDRVLDLCAAPGGKSSQIAAALAGQGVLVSNEPEPSRAKALSGNLERLGVPNAIVVNALPEQLSPLWGEYFDRVLVDAPCSGEGMFRRDPGAREEWNEASPAGCAARQAGILDHAARMLRPGGRLVYSTCTFNRAENEGSILSFLERNPGFEPVDFELPGIGRSEGGMLRLFPHRLRGEGHFVACLKKAGEARKIPAPQPRQNAKELKEALSLLMPAVLPQWPERLHHLVFVREGERLYALPPETPPLDRVRVVRKGLHVCRLGRGYAEPDHALAMALLPGEARCVSVDEDQAMALLRGETLPCDQSGWTQALFCGMPLGWGKASGGVLKNHIPKGLRRAH